MCKKFLLLTLLALVLPVARLSAGEPEKANEFRLGIGDWIFEASYFRSTGVGNYQDRPSGTIYHEKQNYRYIPHIFAEYNRQLRPWLWAGAQVDFGGFSWDSVSIPGGTNTITESSSEYVIKATNVDPIHHDTLVNLHNEEIFQAEFSCLR